jgi:hypothetical protein
VLSHPSPANSLLTANFTGNLAIFADSGDYFRVKNGFVAKDLLSKRSGRIGYRADQNRGIARCTYSGGSDTSALAFTYAVAADQNTPDPPGVVTVAALPERILR